MSLRPIESDARGVHGKWFRDSWVALWLLGCLACELGSSSAAKTKRLVGEYRLAFQTDQIMPGGDAGGLQNLVSDELVLRADGTFDQMCSFKSVAPYRASGGSWRFDGGVYFSSIKDCSGILGKRGETTAASLIIRSSGRSTLILLNPDVNVYYEKVR